MPREIVTLECTEARKLGKSPSRYTTTRNKKTMTEKVEKMTRAQWMKLQAGYKKQKAKYTVCNDKAKAEKLRGRKRWGSIYECMQGS